MADVEKINSMTHKERTELFLNYDRLFTKIENLYRSSKGEKHNAYSKVLDVIADMAVEIVRCKDCKFYSGKYCTLTDDTEDRREPNDYCSCGERKEVQE